MSMSNAPHVALTGGLRLAPCKEMSTHAPIIQAPVPAVLVLPLHQHIGAPAEPLVRVGERVLRGQLIARTSGVVSAALHASSSGTVTAIEPRPVPNPAGTSTPCIVIETDAQDEPSAPMAAMADYLKTDPLEIRARVSDAGIAGLGGAVFPTAIKLAGSVGGVLDTLLINGAECEPYISCDDSLMREQAEQVVEGAHIMLHALQINRCVIAVEADKPQACDALQGALRAFDDERITLMTVPAVYPAGGERQLIQVVLGREVPAGGLPMDIGCLCLNTATVVAIADAVLRGQPLITRVVSVTGNGVAQPCNVNARLGTSFADLVTLAGGYTPEVTRLLMGGIMMGFSLKSDAVPLVKATNCILALTQQDIATEPLTRPCIRCGDCAVACPARLQPQQIHRQIQQHDLTAVQGLNLFDCIECGCCDVVCPSHIPLTQQFRSAKGQIWALERDRHQREQARQRYTRRAERLAREAGARRGTPSPDSQAPSLDSPAPAMPGERMASPLPEPHDGNADALSKTAQPVNLGAQSEDPRQKMIADAVARAREKRRARNSNS